MQSISTGTKLHHSLRIASAMCFIGHGAFGIITKAVWCNYFLLFEIGKVMAYRLMPVLGTVDILMGAILLIRPLRGIALWLVIWGLITALCRPISGEPFAEFIERAGNYGAPLCLLLLGGKTSFNPSWFFTSIKPTKEADAKTMPSVQATLLCTVFLLLAGHGWLNLIQKHALISQYQTLGFSNPSTVAIFAGLFEIIAAISILVRPFRPLIIFCIIWKMGTELAYPHFFLFEWIERGCSYGCLIALWFSLDSRHPRQLPSILSTFF